MKKGALRLFSFVFALVAIVSSFSFNAFANVPNDDSVVEPCFTTIGNTISNITFSGIKATCYSKITAKRSTTLKIKMEIQKKKSSGYTTVETWTKTGSGVSLIAEESRNINILCTYRLKTTFTAGSESVVIYTYK